MTDILHCSYSVQGLEKNCSFLSSLSAFQHSKGVFNYKEVSGR